MINVNQLTKLMMDHLANVANIHIFTVQRLLTEIWTTLEYLSLITVQSARFAILTWKEREKGVLMCTSDTQDIFQTLTVLGLACFESPVEVSVLLIPRLYTRSPIIISAYGPHSNRFLQSQQNIAMAK